MNETYTPDPYYARPEVSNSDLTALKKIFMTAQEWGDVQAAYRFGTLLDCRITEPHKVDVYKRSCQGWIYTPEEMELSGEMKKAFYRDPFCANLANHCSFQKITIRPAHKITLPDGFTFELPMRCKWDLFVEAFDMSGDIKTTTAETQKQFEEAARYFDYDRQRAVYMDLEDSPRLRRTKDILIGISKKNLRVFKIFIERGSPWYKDGRKKFEDLAFKYWYLFGDVRRPAPMEKSSTYTR